MRKVRMYTTYTDSHLAMFERFFRPSVPESFELISHQCEQECPTGEYDSRGWARAVARKVDFIQEAIDLACREGDDYLVFSDCDIRFFEDVGADIAERMNHHDFLALDDNSLCTGFMAIRADDRARFMWEWVARKLPGFGCDQPTANAFIRGQERCARLFSLVPRLSRLGPLGRRTRHCAIRSGKLPRIEYFNHMHLGTEPSIWDGRTPIRISPDQLGRIRMVHANYTVGIANKERLLETVGGMKLDLRVTPADSHAPAVRHVQHPTELHR